MVVRGEVLLAGTRVRYTACAVGGLARAAWVAYAERVHVRLPRGVARSPRRLGELAAAVVAQDAATIRRAMAQASQIDLARAAAAQAALGGHAFLLRGRTTRLEAEEHPGARFPIVEHVPVGSRPVQMRLPLLGRGEAEPGPETGVLRIVVVPGQLARAEAVAQEWLRSQAELDLAERLRLRAAEMGLTYGRVAVRDQTSRWGSCSSSTNLAFNWRLVMAPPEVLDYVVVHELAHLVELNHGPRFWAVVERFCPDWRRSRRWLRTHHPELRVPLRARRAAG